MACLLAPVSANSQHWSSSAMEDSAVRRHNRGVEKRGFEDVRRRRTQRPQLCLAIATTAQLAGLMPFGNGQHVRKVVAVHPSQPRRHPCRRGKRRSDRRTDAPVLLGRSKKSKEKDQKSAIHPSSLYCSPPRCVRPPSGSSSCPVGQTTKTSDTPTASEAATPFHHVGHLQRIY